MARPSPELLPRFQFSLGDACWLVNVLAVLLAVTLWEQMIPTWSILPAELLLIAYGDARTGLQLGWAWACISLAWLYTLMDLCRTLIRCFMILGGPPSNEEMQSRFWEAYGSSVAIPLCLTIPAVYLALKAKTGPLSRGIKWTIASAVIGFVDCTLITLWLVYLFRYHWPEF